MRRIAVIPEAQAGSVRLEEPARFLESGWNRSERGRGVGSRGGGSCVNP